MNPQDRKWNQLCKEVMKTTSHRKGRMLLNHYILVHKFIPVQKGMKIPDAKVAVEKRMVQEGQEQERGYSGSTEKRANCYHV